jgi:hypothetical protein
MILQLARMINEDDRDIIIVLKDHKNNDYSFVKPLCEIDPCDNYAVDNGSIQMALWTVSKSEYSTIKGATFDSSVLPKLQQDALDNFINL